MNTALALQSGGNLLLQSGGALILNIEEVVTTTAGNAIGLEQDRYGAASSTRARGASGISRAYGAESEDS